MTDLTTKLAEAQPVQDLPPLPDAHWVEEFSHGTLVYTADQMHAYARAAQAATPAPALYVGLIERLMRLSTRLGIAHEGGVEHFAASLEDRLYAICRSAEGLLDSMAATPAAEPLGWKLVPVEPTEDMIHAAHDALEKYPFEGNIRRHYRAMLAAAPDAGQGKEASNAD